MNSPPTAPPRPDATAEGPLQNQAPPTPARLAEAEEITRHLAVAEKNFHLYPSYSKVVKHGVQCLHGSLSKFHLTQDELSPVLEQAEDAPRIGDHQVDAEVQGIYGIFPSAL